MGFNDYYVEQMALTRSPSPPAVTSLATNTSDNPPTVVGSPVSGDGLRTTSVVSIVVTCIANPNNTLLGGGTLQCWVWNQAPGVSTSVVPAAPGLWVRVPDLDLSLNWTGTTAQQARAWPALRNPARLGQRILFLTNGVTVSGGGDVQVRIDGFRGAFGS